MAYHFKNLVFEGGGVKGIAYAGALEELQKREILGAIERVGGASAGAIMAVLVGLNYSPEEIRKILWALNFNNFLDDSWGIFIDAKRLLNDFGWYKGDFFRNWIGSIIKARTGNSESTFGDINSKKKERKFKDIYLMGTNLSTHFSEVFSFEHTPRVCLADAVRISMSIPLFFAAKRSARGDVYVDGGVLANYPVKLFDREKYLFKAKNSREPAYYKNHNNGLKKAGLPISKYIYNKETLGFRLDSAKEIAMYRDQAEPPREKIDDFFSYGWALVHTILENQQNTHLHDDDWQRTIYIDSLGVKTTEFDLSDGRKNKLVVSGRKGVTEYFRWYDTKPAINKP
ncbi:MAG: patatin-like phospholipase family protein [candidate division Zixibacteria bacterium]|nr:patatin-like phospholipase family protein [candidate division Zixibacteria bacterium]